MSAEVLRRAAALMRDRARRAARAAEDTGPWSTSWDHSVLTSDGAQMADCFDSGLIAEHIASWHPAVALAVADAFDQHAEQHATSGRDECCWEDWACEVIKAARTFLGEQP